MWADQYVGLPFKRGGRTSAGLDCWGLVRIVLHEQAGILLPSYSEDDPDGWSISKHSMNYRQIKREECKPLDCVILLQPVRLGLAWREVPNHIGIVVDDKHILHIEEGQLSRAQQWSDFKCHSYVRVT